MRIAVIGASGRVGGEVVRQAVGHGSEVVGMAPDPARIAFTHPRLRPVRGDVHDLDSLRAAITGVDAVISAFGASRAAVPGHYSSGIGNVLHAMAELEIPRLVALSAAGALVRDDRNLPLSLRLRLLGGATRACYDDLEAMERRIMASGVTWTIVRATILTDGPFTGRYRTGLDGRALPRSRGVSRADVAAFALKSLTSDLYARRAVFVDGG